MPFPGKLWNLVFVDLSFNLTEKTEKAFSQARFASAEGSCFENKLKPKQKGTDVMKSIVTILTILSLALFASCSGDDGGGGDSNETETNSSE